jgi:hypothetical protein
VNNWCDLTTGTCPRCGLDVDRRGITRELRIECPATKANGYSGCMATPKDGPGTQLKKLLGRIGIVATANCACVRRAREMDRRGAAWCRASIDTIVGWLREEGERRGVPFVEFVARQLVAIAIRRAEKNGAGLPIRDGRRQHGDK